MALVRYDPFRELEEIPSTLRLFHDAVSRILGEPSTLRPWTPACDVKETENEIIVKADVPGVSEKDLEVKLEDGTLTIKGERKFEEEKKGEGYHRIERGYGTFVRCFSVPDTVDPDKVKATYKDGVLTVVLPKKEAAKPRTIKVTTG